MPESDSGGGKQYWELTSFMGDDEDIQWFKNILSEERDKYGANDVMPGLTGWAQINGRDELEIDVW